MRQSGTLGCFLLIIGKTIFADSKYFISLTPWIFSNVVYIDLQIAKITQVQNLKC